MSASYVNETCHTYLSFKFIKTGDREHERSVKGSAVHWIAAVYVVLSCCHIDCCCNQQGNRCDSIFLWILRGSPPYCSWISLLPSEACAGIQTYPTMIPYSPASSVYHKHFIFMGNFDRYLEFVMHMMSTYIQRALYKSMIAVYHSLAKAIWVSNL